MYTVTISGIGVAFEGESIIIRNQATINYIDGRIPNDQWTTQMKTLNTMSNFASSVKEKITRLHHIYWLEQTGPSVRTTQQSKSTCIVELKTKLRSRGHIFVRVRKELCCNTGFIRNDLFSTNAPIHICSDSKDFFLAYQSAQRAIDPRLLGTLDYLLTTPQLKVTCVPG